MLEVTGEVVLRGDLRMLLTELDRIVGIGSDRAQTAPLEAHGE